MALRRLMPGWRTPAGRVMPSIKSWPFRKRRAAHAFDGNKLERACSAVRERITLAEPADAARIISARPCRTLRALPTTAVEPAGDLDGHKQAARIALFGLTAVGQRYGVGILDRYLLRPRHNEKESASAGHQGICLPMG